MNIKNRFMCKVVTLSINFTTLMLDEDRVHGTFLSFKFYWIINSMVYSQVTRYQKFGFMKCLFHVVGLFCWLFVWHLIRNHEGLFFSKVFTRKYIQCYLKCDFKIVFLFIVPNRCWSRYELFRWHNSGWDDSLYL